MNKYPRFGHHTRKGKGGQVWTYYFYDMRPEGRKDVQLGTDYAAALEKWEVLHKKKPLTVGRVQEAIDKWRERALVGTDKTPPEYSNPETRKSYLKQLANIEAVFGQAGWHEITLPVLRQYLDRRTAKTQGNRELSVLSIVWGKARLWGMTALPWPATGVKDWKNPEQAREFEVTDALFGAVYKEADQVLRDCLDIATSTGMRITDARTVRMPVDGKLRFKAGKTGKWAYFEVTQSPVLTALIDRRGQADCTMLLCTPTGLPVSMRMLRTRYDAAREAAAKANPKLAGDLRSMFLRDSRKRAADLAEDSASATALLQHSTPALVDKHYRTKATRLKAVR